jgi:hypothetical protein
MPETLRSVLLARVEPPEYTDDDLVFPQPRAPHKPFTAGYVQKRADAAWKAAGLERAILHELRHGYESFLDAAGITTSANSDTWGTR